MKIINFNYNTDDNSNGINISYDLLNSIEWGDVTDGILNKGLGYDLDYGKNPDSLYDLLRNINWLNGKDIILTLNINETIINRDTRILLSILLNSVFFSHLVPDNAIRFDGDSKIFLNFEADPSLIPELKKTIITEFNNFVSNQVKTTDAEIEDSLLSEINDLSNSAGE